LETQAVVVSIDVKRDELPIAAMRQEYRPTKSPVEWAREVEDRGAGEILLTSVERDGMMDGYDLDLIRAWPDAVNIPVIACWRLWQLRAHAKCSNRGSCRRGRCGVPVHGSNAQGAARYLHEQGFQVRL
jgi:cyclase